jgi:hypothetical protein
VRHSERVRDSAAGPDGGAGGIERCRREPWITRITRITRMGGWARMSSGPIDRLICPMDRAAVKDLQPLRSSGHEGSDTVSFGVASCMTLRPTGRTKSSQTPNRSPRSKGRRSSGELAATPAHPGRSPVKSPFAFAIERAKGQAPIRSQNGAWHQFVRWIAPYDRDPLAGRIGARHCFAPGFHVQRAERNGARPRTIRRARKADAL